MRGTKIFVPLFMSTFWLYACVVIRYDNVPPPIEKEWKFVPMPEVEPEFDFSPLEPDDQIDLKKGKHVITFEDTFNPWVGWEIDHYELINQWGAVISEIPPNDHHRYVVKGIPPGCYTLRAIGRGRRGDVPSTPSNEACTPGLKTGGIWT